MLYSEGGGRTTLHLGPNSSEKLPNIQIGDQNIMMVGGTGACSRRKSKNNKKPKKNIEGWFSGCYDIFYDCHLHTGTCTVA